MMADRSSGWGAVRARLDRDQALLRWPSRLGLALGWPVGLGGFWLLRAGGRADPDHTVWWLVATGVWVLVFLAGYAYLWVWMINRARRRQWLSGRPARPLEDPEHGRTRGTGRQGAT